MGNGRRNWRGNRENKSQYQKNKQHKRQSFPRHNQFKAQKTVPYWQNTTRPQQPMINKLSIREDQVGITEYVSKTAGFIGVVKSRYSDFHVNEIDTNGKVLHFNDMTVPLLPQETLDEVELANAQKEFSDIMTPDVWTNIGLLAAMKASDPAAQPIEINVTALDKEKRTKIHNVLKQLYGFKVVSSTITKIIDSKEERFVKIMKPKGNQTERRQKWTFPGEYVHFLVFKSNMDTSEAASKLAGHLRTHPSKINYCGSKDKRAKTTQKFCIKRREPSHIVSAAQSSKIKVGNFEFSSEVLKLGDLKGNRFRIALRHIAGDEQEIEKCLLNLRDHGFINYFGLQRFGNSPGTPTYEIGVALLKSDYKTVAELILKPRDHDPFFMANIRKFWWEHRDSAAAAAMFRTKDFIEKKLLDGLAEYGEHDYASALRKIPRNMLLLYPHAFQSLVFNLIASRRIKIFGIQLIPGDLVYRNKEELDEDLVEKAKFQCIIEQTGILAAGSSNDAAPEEIETVENVDSVFKRKVKPLTEEDIASGEYTLYDVVLPLPGYDITYPANEVGTWYTEILEEYGLSSENLRHKVKTYSLAGAYRKLLIRPSNLTWKFRKYSDPEKALIASDWDHIIGEAKAIEEEKTEGKSKALLLDFCLPPSVYATMLIRELLKTDTSATSQHEVENNEINKKNQNACEQKVDSENSSSSNKRKLDVNALEAVEEKRLKEDGGDIPLP
ncbi:pseudouridylate synthase 7 homolog [Eurosta solidaginis]|uniref:pseudouridylate synthase 7 homolog n=1 Tax=Eurosta solidaginis TaxID=178769 RepID=UPI00353123AC